METLNSSRQSSTNNYENLNNSINFLHVVVFLFFNFIFLNAIKKNKMRKIKKNGNVFNLCIQLFKELAIVPFLLLVYWFTFTFTAKIVLWFISFIINIRNISKTPNENNNLKNKPINKNTIINTIASNILNNTLLDIKIYVDLFIVNLLILFLILIILIFNFKEKVNYVFVDRIIIIYQFLLMSSIFKLFWKHKK